MHRDLLELLPEATGESEHVIAIFLDVRDFTKFARQVESIETALYLKEIYRKILADYFPDSSFFKLTGDGLMIIYGHDETNLQALATKLITSAFTLVKDFPKLLSGNPMIIFDVPTKIGIGVSRGAATKLVSKSRILDYSGRPLNMASRLMSLARPEGLVLDGSFGANVIGNSNFRKFVSERAYIPGIAEDIPLELLAAKGLVKLSEEIKRPIGVYLWHKQAIDIKAKSVSQRSSGFRYNLEKKPAFPNEIIAEAYYPKITAAGRKGALRGIKKMDSIYLDDSGVDKVSLNFVKLAWALKVAKVKDEWPVKIQISYRYRPED